MKFVVVGAGRTGSTLLISTLNSLPNICCHGELLQAKFVRSYRDGFDPLEATVEERAVRAELLLQRRNRDPVKFIENALTTTSSATGFKALYGQLLSVEFNKVVQRLLLDTDIKFVHLVRENSLRRYVSQVVASQGGAIHSAPGGRGEEKILVHIDIEEFLRTVNHIETQRSKVCKMLSGKHFFDLTYEELARSTSTAVASVCHFLEVDIEASQIQPTLRKVGAVDLSEVVSNYQELIDNPVARNFALLE